MKRKHVRKIIEDAISHSDEVKHYRSLKENDIMIYEAFIELGGIQYFMDAYVQHSASTLTNLKPFIEIKDRQVETVGGSSVVEDASTEDVLNAIVKTTKLAERHINDHSDKEREPDFYTNPIPTAAFIMSKVPGVRIKDVTGETAVLSISPYATIQDPNNLNESHIIDLSYPKLKNRKIIHGEVKRINGLEFGPCVTEFEIDDRSQVFEQSLKKEMYKLKELLCTECENEDKT